MKYAEATEELGYDLLLVNDHFINWTLFCDEKE